MNKAVSWNINGVGFDAREAAREAARRQGKTLGEWLQDVIADHAEAKGLEDHDIEAQDRIDAVTERLERLEAGTERRPVRGRRRTVDPTRRFRGDGAQGSWAAQDAVATEGGETLLDDAIDAMERRALRTERKTDKALASLARMIETTETKRSDEHEMVTALSRKLSDMESRISDRAVDETPIKTALARLERRLETLARAPEPAAPDAEAARGGVPPRRDDGPIERLEAKLNTLLDAVATRPAAMQTSALAAARSRGIVETAAPVAPPAFANRRLGEAIADIANHQRRLERQTSSRQAADLSRGAPPLRVPADPAGTRPSAEIALLATKIDALRGDFATEARAGYARDDMGARIEDLRAEISDLSQVIRDSGARNAVPGQIAQMSTALDAMRREIARRDDAKLEEVASRADLESLKADIGGISRTLGQLAPRGSVTALEDAIRGLTVRLETSREALNRDGLGPQHPSARMAAPAARPLDGGHNRREAADAAGVGQTIGGLEREVRTIGAKLNDLNGVNVSMLGDLQHQTGEIRDLLSNATVEPFTVERLEERVAALAKKMDAPAVSALDGHAFRKATADIQTLIDNPPHAALLDVVERRLQALTEKVDQAVEAASGARKVAEASRRRFDDVQEQIVARLDDRGPASGTPDVRSLETLVRDLAERIETARGPEAGHEAIEALQEQIARLSNRFDRTDGELSALSAIERSMHELFTHLEETRASVETTAVRAAREAATAALAGRTASDPAALREIAVLKSIQEDADHRTHATLNAVHETLERVVDRLSLMENEVATGRPTRSQDEGSRFDDRARTGEPTGRRARPLPDLILDPSDALDGPIAARPPRARPAATPPAPLAVSDDEIAGRSDFIAAARRAARTAQNDPSVLAIKRPEAQAKSADLRATLMATTRDYVASHKKPVLLSIAALFVLLGAIAVMGRLQGGDTTQLAAARPAMQRAATVAAAEPRRPETPAAGRTTRADLTPSALPQAPTPAGAALPGSDPITTGSITRLPSFAAQSATPAGPSLPGGRLKEMADANDAAAQYEIASRYAEGRLLTKDFKLAAEWYEKAAQQGLAPAQYKLAALYEKGLGVARDKARAKFWYIKAADAGNPRAMHNLAVLVADGDGKPDYTSAVIWFRKAAEYGIHDSQYNLAILLARGLGTPQSLVQSYQWFAVAAQQNDADAATKRDEVAAKMSASDLMVAKTLASTFHPKIADVAVVQIEPPAGGWDGAPPASLVRNTRAKLSSL